MKKLGVMLLALLAVGCSHPNNGQVTRKTHKDAYSYVQMVCSAYGKNGICTVWVPITHHVDECWGIHLVNGEEDWGECIAKEEWDRLSIGSTWERLDKS